MLKAFDVTGARGYGPDEGPFWDQVIPHHPQEVPCSVLEFLCGSDHVDLFFQQLPSLFLGEVVFSHRQQDLEPHFMFLCIRSTGQFRGGDEGGQPCGSIRIGNCQYVALRESLSEVIQDVEFLPCVGQVTFILELDGVAHVQEAVNGVQMGPSVC